MVDQDGKITLYTYDGLNRLKTLTDPQGKVTTYNYDQVSNLKSVNYPNSTTATSTFDNLNRLLSLTNKTTAGSTISSYQYQYDSIGRRTKVTLADATVNFGYDNISRLTSELRAGSNPYNISYAYDKLGNRLLMTKGANTTLYNYNSLNQLLEERRKSTQDSTLVTVSGTIDDNTALVSVQGKSATVSSGTFSASGITANRGLNLITAMAQDLAGNQSYHQIQLKVVDPLLRSYTYDNNGNLIKKQEGANITTYVYDYENRLTQVTLNGSTIATYVYDGEGKRVKATESGVTTNFLYDGLNVIIERNSSGVTTATYTRGLSYGGGIGGIISRKDSTGTYYYHYDGSGNVMQLTDSAGSVVKTYTYEAFGSLVAQSGTVANPYQFQSKHTSSTTGLVHFGARYYNPLIGRFAIADPLGFVTGPNLYTYVRNNPTNLIDPWGLCEKTWGDYYWDALRQILNEPSVVSNRYLEEAWIRALGRLGAQFSPTPERILRWTGRIISELGYTWAGRITGAFGVAGEPGGIGKGIGMIVGGATGAIGGRIAGAWIGSLVAPGAGTIIGARIGGIIGGIGGGMVGGWIGGYFDYPGAGQPNYNEWE